MSTIKDKIEYLNETKRRIRAAIISRNVQVGENDTFRSYADKIRNIPVTAEVDVMALDATENKEYNAGEGKAYNPVTVNVKPNVSEKTINKVGVYKASDDDVDGYSKVTVDVSTSLTTKTVTSEDLPETPTAKTFKASDEGDDKVGYSQFTVDVSGTVGEKQPIQVDPTQFGVEQVYEAKDDGLYGYSKITIRLVESPGPFRVRFYNGTTLLEEHDNVMRNQTVHYGTAYPSGPTPENFTPEGKRFTGWNPDPLNVTTNLDCYAQFEDAEDIVNPGGTVTQSWSEILANGGADVPLGGTKKIYYGSYEYNGMSIAGGNLTMQKVYIGESGSTSTWLSTDSLLIKKDGGYPYYADGKQHQDIHNTRIGWAESDLRRFLNGSFIAAIENCADNEKGVSSISKAIKSVNKYSRCFLGGSSEWEATGSNWQNWKSNDETSDKIWLPSDRELTGGTDFEQYGASYVKVNSSDKRAYFSNAQTGITRSIGTVARALDTDTGKLASYYINLRKVHSYGELVVYPCINSWSNTGQPEDVKALTGFKIGFCT